MYIEINNNHVIAALDFSRVYKGFDEISLYSDLNDIVHLGREIDLLETIRRQDNPEYDCYSFPKQQLTVYGRGIRMDPTTLEKITLNNFVEDNLILLNDEAIEVNFKDWRRILHYGKSQIQKNLKHRSQELLNLLAKGMVQPVHDSYYQEVISNFPLGVQTPLEDYLSQSKLLCPIQAKESIYYSSPKIYKHQESFRKILELNEDAKVFEALEYLNKNPGIPLESINPEDYNHSLLKGLSLSGALDTISLDVNGSSHEYLIPSNLNTDRLDKDHLDQVKKTLANFRFGQSYAKWTLRSPKIFLEKLLENGFAGNASVIGTDYRHLEAAGIVSVEKISGSNYRFWMLKKDIIEDTVKVLNGSVPVISKNPNLNIDKMDDTVLSRMILDQTKEPDVKIISDALRKLERGLL